MRPRPKVRLPRFDGPGARLTTDDVFSWYGTTCFVCVWFFVPLKNFLLTWRRHHCWWGAANFDLRSALIAIEQWGFFCVPHLLWHETSVYNGQFRGSVTLISIAKHLAVELSLPVLRLRSVVAAWDSNTRRRGLRMMERLPNSDYLQSSLTLCI